MRTYHDRTGRQVTETDAHDHRGVLKDGVTMRTKVTMMDGASIAPSGVSIAVVDGSSKTDREAAYNDRIQRMSDAWKLPPLATPLVHIEGGPKSDQQHDHDQLIDRRNRRLEEAWRGTAASA